MVAGLGIAFSLAMPYMNSSNTINEFVEVSNDDIVYVQDNNDELLNYEESVEDSIPYGEVPEGLSFEGNVVGYLSDSGDVLNNVYPITQSSTDDPNHFIDHDVYDNYSEFGNMYKDSRNHRGLKDDVTAIYGHNLIDGSMFGVLADYADKEGYLGNRSGQDLYNSQKETYGNEGNSFIYTDEYGQYKLDVAAAGVYDGRDVLSFVGDFDNDKDREKAINLFNEGSDIISDVKLDKDSKIVILQTCEDGDSVTYGDETKRIYVICKATQLVKYKDYENDNSKTMH